MARRNVTTIHAPFSGSGTQINGFGGDVAELLRGIPAGGLHHAVVGDVRVGGSLTLGHSFREDGERRSDSVVLKAEDGTRRYVINGVTYDAARVRVQLRVTTDDGKTALLPFEGKVEIHAPGAGHSVDVSVTSADVSLTLGPEARVGAVKTVSGDVILTAPGGTVAAVKTVSGAVTVHQAARVGDCTSVSGRVEVHRASPPE